MIWDIWGSEPLARIVFKRYDLRRISTREGKRTMKTALSLLTGAGMLLAAQLSFAADAPAIPSTSPLEADAIVKLIDGHTFAFTAYDAPLTAVTHWDMSEKKVSGDYVFKGEKGTFETDWSIEGDKSCTLSGDGGAKVCQTIYAYQNGFMEVNADGTVHGVSIPK
jgi:hypothetical protein